MKTFLPYLLSITIAFLSYGQEHLTDPSFESAPPFEPPAGYTRTGGTQLFGCKKADCSQASGSVEGSNRAVIIQRRKDQTTLTHVPLNLVAGNYTLSWSFKDQRSQWVGARATLKDAPGGSEIVKLVYNSWGDASDQTVPNNNVIEDFAAGVWATQYAIIDIANDITGAEFSIVSDWHDGAGVIDNVSLFNNAGLGVNNTEDFGFIFYPNPAKEKLQLMSAKKIQNIAIFNSLGQEMLNINEPSNIIEIPSFNSGVYIIKTTIEDKEQSYRFIKD